MIKIVDLVDLAERRNQESEAGLREGLNWVVDLQHILELNLMFWPGPGLGIKLVKFKSI